MPAKPPPAVAARRRAEQKPIRITAGARAAIHAADDQPGADGKPKLRTFEGVAYTGAVMEPGGWYGRIICDLAGIKVPKQQRPMLRQHDHEQIVGHTTGVGVAAEITVAGVFSGERHHTDKVLVPADNGFEWELSIGAVPHRTEFLEAGEEAEVNGRTVVGPLTISRETLLEEVSFVPLGADGDTSVSVSASKGVRAMQFKAAIKALKAAGNVRAAKYSDEDIEKMSEDEAKAALAKCMEDGVDAEGEDDEDEDDTDLDAEGEEEKPKAKARKGGKTALKAGTRKGFRAAIEAATVEARKEAAAEARRQNEIKARCQKFPGLNRVKLDDGTEVDLIPHAIEAGWSADKAELYARRADRPQAGDGPRFHFGSGTPQLGAMDADKASAVLECAVFQADRSFELLSDSYYTRPTPEREPLPARDADRFKRDIKARYTEEVQDTAHRIFRGRIGLQQLLTIIARGGGYDGANTITADNLGHVAAACGRIQADGSTVSVQNVTSNVQNKYLLQGYLFTEQAWRKICAFRSVKDFKATKSINLFGDVEFQDLGPNGELAHATLQDQAFANQVTTSGRTLTLPRTIIINDDLGAFGQVPMLMGRGAGLKLNKAVWTKWLSPGNDDGGSTAFFAATHTITGQSGNSNLSTGAAASGLTSTGLTNAVKLFDGQVDPKNYPLGIDAAVLLYPPDLETAALELMKSETIVYGGGSASKQPATNIWKGRFDPVKSRYLNKTNFTGYSTTAWYLLADPNVMPAIEVAFLNGQEMPTVQTAGPDFKFDTLGITTRAFFDIGVNMQNFRGAVKSTGAD